MGTLHDRLSDGNEKGHDEGRSEEEKDEEAFDLADEEDEAPIPPPARAVGGISRQRVATNSLNEARSN